MKQKSINRFQNLRCFSSLALVTAITSIASVGASAATYQWNGSQSSNWLVTANWTGLTAPAVPDHGGTFNHRLSVNGATTLEYNFPLLNPTVYANTSNTGPNFRGLVIGSGSSGSMLISGGTFSTFGSTAADVLGNGGSNSGSLTIDGTANSGNAHFISTNAAIAMGLGFGTTATLSVKNGSATLAELRTNNTTATLNLETGGTLAMNNLAYNGGGSNIINFDGGTLKARISSTTFIATPGSGTTTINVKSGGAIIDTNGFAITIARPLLQDGLSTGGGIIKNGNGTLTLGAVPTTTGPTTINGGGLGVKSGPTSWTPSTFTHSGDKLNFDLGIFDENNLPAIDVADLTLNSNLEVNISGSSIPIASEIIILDYGTKSGTGSLTLNASSLPSNMVATLEENTTEGYYYLNVTSPSATAFIWSAGTGDWDTSTANWNSGSSIYAEPAIVSFPNLTGGGTIGVTQNVAPISIAISNASGNPYTFGGNGLITGSTGVTKTGTGIARFNGAAHNYSGSLAINAGAIIKQAADATTGGITVATDNVSFVLDGGITDGADQTLTISGRGAIDANYFYTNSAVQRGALQAHNGASTWQGNIVLASNSITVMNRIGVQNGASLTLTGAISESVAGAPLLFRAGLSGDDINLSGTNTYSYTGQTQIFSNGGSIILGTNNKLPTTSNVFLGSGGSTVFDLNGFNQEFAGITGNAFGNAATIANYGNGPSTLTTTSPAETPTETADYYPGLIADGAQAISFVKNGNGTQVLAGSNSYTGTTTIHSGRLEIQENQFATGDVIINGGNLKLSFGRTLSFGVNMSISSGAFFYLDGSNQTLGKLEGTGTIGHTFTNAGVDTITVGANDATCVFDGVIQESTARTYALTKIGAGTFTLTGANTYTGNTTVEDGTLSVAQSNFADTSTVTIGTQEASPAVLNLPNPGTDIVASLIIDGVSQPGDGAVYDSANSDGAITGSGKIQVGTAPGGYEQWALDNNVTEGTNGDDDKDGIINLVEYALGLDPQIGDPAPGTFVGNLLTFTKGTEAKAAGDVSYVIQTSTTLGSGSWNTAVASENADSISYELPANQPGGKLFARLQVTRP